MRQVMRGRRACAVAIAIGSLAWALTASAGAADYTFQSWRGVKCTLHTDHSAWGAKSEHSISYSSSYSCNRPLVRIEMWSYLIRTTPTVNSPAPATISWDNDECNDSRTCGTSYVPYTSKRVDHLNAGAFVQQTNTYAALNGHGGDSDPLDSKNDWWIAADARNQCTPGAWGLSISCQLYEPVAAAP